ncbi:cell envelope integrity protein TolA [Thiomicrorhabdus arctica]|uniref:cell envelope integrity protein TolA n=1 Tax=Thiomicrorhabdus arctica TaxID=131540 RepID=UPI0003622F90|nr:cell envelope integrity protein TolA [Thiomicrorhabdus arctica]
MLSFITRHPIAVILALILHIAIGVLITYEWHDSTKSIKISVQGEADNALHQDRQDKPFVNIEPLKTFAVDSALVKQQLERIKSVELAKKREQEQLAAKTDKERQHLKELQLRQKEEQLKAEKAAKETADQILKTEAERKKTEEAKRLASLEKKKADNERAKAEKAKKASLLAEKERQLANEKMALAQKQRQVEEEKKNALVLEIERKDKENKALALEAEKAKATQAEAVAAAALQRQLDEESAAQRAIQKRQQLLSLRQTYISSISAKVKDNWRTPARISPEAQCDLRITQTPAGSVTSVRIVNCNSYASKQFKDAAEKAVYRSEPLPAPPVKELFERVITFEFKP